MRLPLPRLTVSALAIFAWGSLKLGGAAPTPQSSNGKPPIRECVGEVAWSQGLMDLAPNCERAVEIMREKSEDYLGVQGAFRFYPDHSYVEFPDLGKSTALPKLYEYENCVVAVIMMNAFTNRPKQVQFPHVTSPFMPGRWSRSDTTTFASLIEEADEVRATCLNGMGYSLTGDLGSIGVAITARGSRWDTFMRSWVPPVPPGYIANATSAQQTSDSGIAIS